MIPMKPTTRAAIQELCQHINLSDEQCREFNILFETQLTEVVLERDKVLRDNRGLLQKLDNAKEVLKQTGQRYNAQLMSVFYLLGSLEKVGTHHEKEVVIRFIRQTLDDLLDKNGDRLSWDQDLLPF